MRTSAVNSEEYMPIRQLEKCTIFDFSKFHFCIYTWRSGGMIEAYSGLTASKLAMVRMILTGSGASYGLNAMYTSW